MFRVIELRTGRLLYENANLEKAKNYAELYKKNMGKSSTIQHCQTVWSTDTLDEVLNDR